MREIKFRAWNERKGWKNKDGSDCTPKMEYDGFVIYPDGKKEFPQGGWDLSGINAEMILMQYTGLKDRNGKEIYEGDIVKGIVKQPQLLTWDNDENCNTKMGGEVFYDHHGFSLKVIENLCEKERDGMCNYFDFMSTDDGDFSEIEIIGNIYENPELIK